ncbi:MAG: lipase family protein [Gemmatimonadetes bacterium]|nr:lipase family protein [Gemmatimonadota bacterium]
MAQVIGRTEDGDSGEAYAMTLAAIAYCSDIPTALQQNAPMWKPAWIPDQEVNGNFAYVAYSGQQYVVAIRGSVLSFSWESFQDWFEQDFNVLYQSPWTYTDDANGAQTSRGAADGLSDLTSLVSTVGGKQVRLLDFLMDNAVANEIPIAVTGHSLGGGLATVFAPWLQYQITTAGKTVPGLVVMTFAAPAVGNQAFAQAYDAMFGANAWRFYNELDIVPMASASITDMANLYPAPLQASQITATYDIDGYSVTASLWDAIYALAATVDASELYYSSWYTQTNAAVGSVPLNQSGELSLVTSDDPLVEWLEQAGGQHSVAMYLQQLGAPVFTCPSSLAEPSTTPAIIQEAAAAPEVP